MIGCNWSVKSKGFTLVELVVTIVILGVLAVSAAPKFLDLKTDAVIVSLKTLQGGFKSTNNMVYAKAIFKGINTKYTEHGNGGSWQEDCSVNNCVEVGGVWLYFKLAYLDRNCVAFAVDADIRGKETKSIKNKATQQMIIVPNRTIKGGSNTECTNSDVRGKICEGHDFCQCRDKKNISGNQWDGERFIPRGYGYNGNCYLKYTSAEAYTGGTPIYELVTDGC